MPIDPSWNSLIQGLNSQYCKGKSNGAPAPFKCKKSRSVFYAMMRKNKWDESKPRPKSKTKNEDDENEDQSDFAKLAYAKRKKLPDSAFCDPEGRRYPAHDKPHIRNGLARIQQNKGDPKYQSILSCLLKRAKKAGIKSSIKKGKEHDIQYPDSDFAFVRESDNYRFFQIRENGILKPSMLLESLETVHSNDELTDDEYLIAYTILTEEAEQFIRVIKRK